MHREILPGLAATLRDRATNVVWVQWAALGSGAVSKRAPRAVVDPEALVLSSLGLVDHERHLADLLAWCSSTGTGLLSVQRIRNLGGQYPEVVRTRLKEFASYAWAAGDHRWKPLAESRAKDAPDPGGAPRLEGPALVMLRLRLGLGVGIKADLVSALLGMPGWWTVRELSGSTAYTPRAVRRAADELARGGWITASPASPAEYRVRAERWLPLLGMEAPAEWLDWARLLALVLAVDAWVRSKEWAGQKLETAERTARGLVDAHRGAFKWAGVPVPPPVSRPGAEYIRAFESSLLRVTERMEAGV